MVKQVAFAHCSPRPSPFFFVPLLLGFRNELLKIFIRVITSLRLYAAAGSNMCDGKWFMYVHFDRSRSARHVAPFERAHRLTSNSNATRCQSIFLFAFFVSSGQIGSLPLSVAVDWVSTHCSNRFNSCTFFNPDFISKISGDTEK